MQGRSRQFKKYIFDQLASMAQVRVSVLFARTLKVPSKWPFKLCGTLKVKTLLYIFVEGRWQVLFTYNRQTSFKLP